MNDDCHNGVLRNSLYLLLFVLLFTSLISPALAEGVRIASPLHASSIFPFGSNQGIYLTVFDSNDNALSNLGMQQVSLQVDGQSHPIDSWSLRKEVQALDLTLLVRLQGLDEATREILADEWLTQLNGLNNLNSLHLDLGQGTLQAVEVDDETALKKALLESFQAAQALSAADFNAVLKQGFNLRRRNALVVLTDGLQPDLMQQFSDLTQRFQQRQVTFRLGLVSLQMNARGISQPDVPTQPDPNKSLFETTNQIDLITQPLELQHWVSSQLKALSSEYILRYHLLCWGGRQHQVALYVHTPQGSAKWEGLLRVKSIWPVGSGKQSLLVIIIVGVTVLLLSACILLLPRQHLTRSTDQVGFQVLNPTEKDLFIPLEENQYTMDFLNDIPTHGNLRLSANLGKVYLTKSETSYFLEDKNYKNALLINRRRVRRTQLKDSDLLDIGEMTLIYRNHQAGQFMTQGRDDEEEQTDSNKKEVIEVLVEKPKGPIRKGIPQLLQEDRKLEIPLMHNITYFGSSTYNNIILKGQNIAGKHAKISRIGSQYKIQDLGSQEGTYINGRRIEQRFLRDNDEIIIDSVKFKFKFIR